MGRGNTHLCTPLRGHLFPPSQTFPNRKPCVEGGVGSIDGVCSTDAVDSPWPGQRAPGLRRQAPSLRPPSAPLFLVPFLVPFRIRTIRMGWWIAPRWQASPSLCSARLTRGLRSFFGSGLLFRRGGPIGLIYLGHLLTLGGTTDALWNPRSSNTIPEQALASIDANSFVYDRGGK